MPSESLAIPQTESELCVFKLMPDDQILNYLDVLVKEA